MVTITRITRTMVNITIGEKVSRKYKHSCCVKIDWNWYEWYHNPSYTHAMIKFIIQVYFKKINKKT